MSIESVAPGKISAWTQRLHDVMPFGSSTSSKAPSLEPGEPAVIVRGEGMPGGFWPCPLWSYDRLDSARFFCACNKHGLSLYNVSYVNFSHRDADVDEAVARFEKVCNELRSA